MALAPLICLLYTLLFSAAVDASSDTSLSPNIAGFVPPCAQRCVLSFLQVNYEGTACDKEASLQCLCSTRGNTEFTLGEGVVQCITAERRFGQCPDSAASQDVADRAYFMCDDELRAIQPTHTLITASLVLPTTRGGFVSFPQVSTGTEEPRPTSLPSTLVTETSPSPTVRPSTRLSTRTAGDTTSTKGSTSAASSTSGTTATPGQGDEDDEDSKEENGGGPTLGAGQVAGISIGVVAAAGVAVGAIFLARRCRQRRHPGVSTGFLPRRSTWGYLGGQRPKIASLRSTPSWPRVPPPSDHGIAPVPPPPLAARKSYTRASWYPGGIGMALSPPFKKDEASASESPKPRRISKLLPAKPIMTPILARFSFQRESGTQEMSDAPPQLPPLIGLSYRHRDQTEKQLPQAPLTLHIPHQSTLPAAAPSRTRDSTMTEFEEDGGSSVTSPHGQIWRHPSQNLASSYVADKNGNWVLRNSSKPEQAPSLAVPMTAPPTQNPNPFKVVNVPEQTPSIRRSLSQHGPAHAPRLAPAPVITRATDASESYFAQPQESPTPKPLFSASGRSSVAGQGQNPFSHQDPKQGPSRPPMYPIQRDRASSRSSDTTVFESSSDESKEPTPPEAPPQGSLSPVVESAESPASASVNRPPVMLHPSQGRVNMNYAPPPRRPNMYQPPGQPSPTLGMVAQQNQQRPSPQGFASYNVASKMRRPMDHHPSSARTGSPTMRVVEPSPEPDDRVLLPSARGYHHRRVSSASRASHQQVMPSPTQQQYSFPPPRSRPGMPHHPYQQPRQQDGPYPRKQTPYMRPSQMTAAAHNQRGLPHSPPFQSHQLTSSHQYPSQNRPPPHRLATDIPPGPPAAGLNTFASPVSESSASSSLLAKRLGSGRAAQMAIPTDQHHSQQQGGGNWQMSGPPPQTPRHGDDGVDLPRTPGWMPKLTPTRRGGDLFLNVQ